MIGTSLLFSGSIGGLLTPFDSDAPTAGYSLRNLGLSYSGAVVRVRRSGDNEEKDFNSTSITNGTLDDFLITLGTDDHSKEILSDFEDIPDFSLLCACNVGRANELDSVDEFNDADGFVSKWYDQFGSNDAEQTTADNQPKIWDASTGLVTENGKPAVDFDGNDDVLKIPDFAYNVAGGKLTIFATSLCEASTSGNQYLFAHYEVGTNDRSWAIQYDDGDRFRGTYSSDGTALVQFIEFDSFSFNTQYLTYYIFDTSLSLNNRIDGSYNGVDFTLNIRTGDNSSLYNSAGDLSIGAALSNGSPVATFNGLVQEIIFYDSDQSTNRTKIEDNINDYYDIY